MSYISFTALVLITDLAILQKKINLEDTYLAIFILHKIIMSRRKI